jgi:hypothetical protein
MHDVFLITWLHSIYCLFICGRNILVFWILDLALARQALLTFEPFLQLFFALVIFLVKCWIFDHGWPWTAIILLNACIVWITDGYYHTQLICWDGVLLTLWPIDCELLQLTLFNSFFFFFFFFAVLVFELRAYTLNYSTSCFFANCSPPDLCLFGR